MKKPTKAFNIQFSQSSNSEGWCYGRPVGIKTIQWPRSRRNGLPMIHIWTFIVPEEYRVKGEEYIAISLFQADDHISNDMDGVSEIINNKEIEKLEIQTFWNSLITYTENKHPMEIYMEDGTHGGWAMIWLTENEFNSNLTQLPDPDNCINPKHNYHDFDKSCFKQDLPPKYVKLVSRENDPNIGRTLEAYPDEDDENAYIEMYSEKGEELNLSEKFFGKTHFGGTASPYQDTPEFSPYYIEFEEGFGDANMGGGNGQIDLLNGKIEWAC